jgi:multiple antibiotic resistance protein
MTTLSAAMLLFLIMDPLGNIPVFLALLKDLPAKRRRFVLARELIIALFALFAFLLGGRYILQALHLSEESVGIAGGIILFLIGIRMIFPPKEGLFGDTPDGEPFIVPLAIPGVAGPSAMAALMLLAHDHPKRVVDWSIALLAAWAATAIILGASTALYKFLKPSFLSAMEKLMGMVLVAVSVQMFLDGVAEYLKGVS